MKNDKFQKMIMMSVMFLLAASPCFAGDVTGTINFTGTAPAKETINMSADPTCAAAHSGPVYTESVVVNDNGTLKNVFVYVKQGLEGKNFPAPKDAVVFDQDGCHYMPHVMGVQTGQPVEIRNSDATLHNVHSLAKNSKEFNLGMPIKGMKLKKTFDKEEIMVKVKCDVHPWMSAYIGVLTHPFFAVSGDDGSFTIKGLPAGTYTIEAWHETYGTQTQEVTVGDDGSVDAAFSFAG